MISEIPIVSSIPTDQFPTPAKRPHNSRVDCSKITGAFGIKPDNWQESLGEMLDELRGECVT